MKFKWKKFNNLSISYSFVFALTLLILIILLIPLLSIASYNVPSADDFSFSCDTHAAVTSGQSFINILSIAYEETKHVFTSWQGTFSAVFMMALQPSIWGFRYYSITTWIMLSSLISGIFFLCFRLFSGLFHIQKSVSGIIAAVICIICTQFLPAANESFYWYNGSVYYTFTFGIMLIMYAVYIGFYLHGSVFRILLLCLLSVITGGSNYITALLSSVITSVVLINLLIKKDRKLFSCLIPYSFLIISFIISISAPGNAVRQAANSVHPDAVPAILLSFKYAMSNAVLWTDLRFISCILFLLPFIWAAAASCNNKFSYPLLITLISFCIYSSAFTPHIYALGTDGPNRLKNIVFFFYVLLFVINLFWWSGWITNKNHTNRETSNHRSIAFRTFVLLSSCSLIILIIAVYIHHSTLTSALAFNSLRSGEAQDYYKEASYRQVILEDPKISRCEFEQFNCYPIVFYMDMTDDPENWTNIAACKYYNKSSIMVR